MRLAFIKVIKYFHFNLDSVPDETLSSSREKISLIKQFLQNFRKGPDSVFFKSRTSSCFVWATFTILKDNPDYWILHFDFNEVVTIKQSLYQQEFIISIINGN